MHSFTNSLQQALSAHRIDGRHSCGTAAIVESLHTDFNHSYEQLADIAQVSIAGLGRWRKRDKGDREAFAPLLHYAEKLLGAESGKADPAVSFAESGLAATARQHASASEMRQPFPLTIAEAKLGLSLKFGVDPAMIDIVIRG